MCVLLDVTMLVLIVTFVGFIGFFVTVIPHHVQHIGARGIFKYAAHHLHVGFILRTINLITVDLLVTLCVIFVVTPRLAKVVSSSTQVRSGPAIALFLVITNLLLTIIDDVCPTCCVASIPPTFTLGNAFNGATSKHQLHCILLALRFIVSVVLVVYSSFVHVRCFCVMGSSVKCSGRSILVPVFLQPNAHDQRYSFPHKAVDGTGD